MGQSAQLGLGYKVSVWGKAAKDPPVTGQVVGNGIDRSSWFKRIRLQARFYRDLGALQPDILVVCTFELLLVAAFFRLTHPSVRLVYDVRENYVANMLYANSWSLLLRGPLAMCISLIEQIGCTATDQIWVAESCYKQERRLFEDATLIPNYALESKESRTKSEETLKMLISGTLGRHYGTLESINWFISMAKESEVPLRLVIAGYSADTTYAKAIRQSCTGQSAISLIGVENPVDPLEIEILQAKADVLLLPYRPNKSTYNRVPTKYFEAQSKGLPIILQTGAFKKLDQDELALLVNFEEQIHEKAKVQHLVGQIFSCISSIKPDTTYTWPTIEPVFLSCLQALHKS